MRRALIALTLAGVLAGCSSHDPADVPNTAGQVDLKRYQGTWYELARLPMFFQRNCAQSEAHYQLQADDSVAVTNRCLTKDGEWEEAKGRAELQPWQTDKLTVRFDNWFSRLFPNVARGDYWILYLDPDYRVALVGNPNREYLWLLSRTPEVSAETRAQLLKQAETRGYDTQRLIWRTPAQSAGD